MPTEHRVTPVQRRTGQKVELSSDPQEFIGRMGFYQQVGTGHAQGEPVEVCIGMTGTLAVKCEETGKTAYFTLESLITMALDAGLLEED